MNSIQKAAEFAAKAHEGQELKGGKPYFTHVEAVANIVNTDWFRLINKSVALNDWNQHKDHVVAAAYLHATIEWCGVTQQQLKDEGFSVMTAELVHTLSKKPGENYFDFIMRIHDGGAFRPGLVAVKLADLEHTISGLTEGTQVKDKYRLAHYILSYFNPEN